MQNTVPASHTVSRIRTLPQQSNNPYLSTVEPREQLSRPDELRCYISVWLLGVCWLPILEIVSSAFSEVMPSRVHWIVLAVSPTLTFAASAAAPVAIRYRIAAFLSSLIMIPLVVLLVTIIDLFIFGFDFDGIH